MRCNWDAFLKLLPIWLREPVDRLGKETLCELRMRIGQPPQLQMKDRCLWLDRIVDQTDISFCVNVASQYSPWYATTIASGYITAPGGHRLGICGDVVLNDGQCSGFRFITSLCIRVARDFWGISNDYAYIGEPLLLIGPPGSGKTTLMRDIVRRISDHGSGSIVVIDERAELFPMDNGRFCFPIGRRTDVLTGCKKGEGIISAIRSMGPAVVAMDEVTDEADCQALIQAAWCGVRVIATAHAQSIFDLQKRSVYRPLLDSDIFDRILILQQDKSWRLERMRHDN